ncbi:MAG: carbohydrate-binding family 9-like protein, partial [Planctomycetota bacterium]
LWLEKPYRDGGPVHRGHNLEGVRYAVAVDGTLNDPRDTDKGWSVEIAFPWAALRKFAGEQACPPRDGDQWRINFSRVHWLADIIDGEYRKVPREAHAEDNWVWTPQDAIDMHRPEKWGYVEFATQAREPRRDGTWPARELLMELYYQHKAGVADYVVRGVRACPDYRVEHDPWRATISCAGQQLSVDSTGRIHTD